MNKIVHFSAKSFFLRRFAGDEKCKLDNYAEPNSLNPIFFMLKAPKDGQKSIVFTKTIFPGKVRWTGEKQFWHVCRNKFANLSDVFCPEPTIDEKFVFILPIDFSWKYLVETKNAILTEPPKHFGWSLDFFGSKCGKSWTKNVTFSVIFFPRSVSWTPNNATLTILLQIFRRKTKFYRLKAEFARKIVSFSRETMTCEKFLWTRKRQFRRSFRYNFCCSPFFSAQSAKNKSTHFIKRIFQLNVSWTKEMQF